MLVTAQVSLALALMIVATLLTRTVINLQSRPLGFDPEGLLSVSLDLPESGYPEAESRRLFYGQVREAVGAVAGLGDVELLSAIPGADFGARRALVIEGREPVEGAAPQVAATIVVSPGYFDMIGLEIQQGRGFGDQDGPESFPVTVVSREVANDNWPGEDPVGRRLQISGSDDWVQVIGVVGDVRAITDSDRPARNVYLAHSQQERLNFYLLARTTTDPAALAGPIRSAVWSVDAAQPVDAIRTVKQAHYERDASSYALITLFMTFAVFALLMSAIGIYGVMSYTVSQRQNEIGLRMALGAEVGAVRWMVVGQGIRMLAVGIAIGLLAAYVMSRLLGNVVFGISSTDPATFIGVPILLAVVALVANFLPARRATRMDPANTLRAD